MAGDCVNVETGDLVEKSWNKLFELKDKINFVLIGGWAVYLYTKRNKATKDIDMIVDYDTLGYLQATYQVNRNERLRKYDVKLEEGFDIDVYVPKFSKLIIPVEDILNLTIEKEGFIMPRPEVLLILKLDAFIDRQNSIKGRKDATDITGLVFFAGCDFKFFKELTIKYDLPDYPRILLSIIENFDRSRIKYLNLNENEFSKLKKKYIEEIRKIL